ncbi:hypothetical protein ACFLQK_02655 [bacterium]
MAKTKWDRETIIKRILALEDLDEDLTCSNVKEIDSALVGAAISYFGNWSEALKASGLDYEEIQKLSKQRRREKVRKWSEEKVLEDIRKVAETEEDLSCAYMKEKYSTLVAAASNYIGSWKKALEMLGFDYSEVLRIGRQKRKEREKAWHQTLLLERMDKLKTLDENLIKEKEAQFHAKVLECFSSWRKAVLELKKWRGEKENNGKD